LILCS